MGIFQNIKNLFSREEKKVNPAAAEMYQFGQYELGSAKNKELLTEMKGWVYSCVNAISDELGNIQIKLFENKNGEISEIEDHKALDLLYKVNDFTTKFDFFWLIGAYLELTGEAPLFLEKNGKEIEAIYFLRPDKITPLADKKTIIGGYRYEIGNGKRIVLPMDEVIFLRYPDPARPFRGLGTLEAAARVVDVDNFAETWNLNFYKNAAVPDSILTVNQQQMNDEQKNVLKNSIKEQYQGTTKSHKMMVLFGDMKLDKFSMSQKDMDFLQQQKFSRDKILGIFRVPKAIIAQTEGVNFASSKVAESVFARWTINPKMERIVQQFNEFYLPMFEGTENMFFDFVNTIPDDAETKAKVYKDAVNLWMTMNEARSNENLPPVENGDEIYLPMNLLPVGEVSEKGMKNVMSFKTKSKKKNSVKYDRIKWLASKNEKKNIDKKKSEELKSNIKEMLKEEIGKEDDNQDVQWDGKKKVRFWHVKDKIFIKHVKEVRDRQKKVFGEQRKEVLKKLNKQKAVEKKIEVSKLQLNKEEEAKRTIRIVLPILEEVFKEGADKTFDFLDIDMEMDVTTPEVQKLLKSKTREFANATTVVTNEFINKEVAEGLRLNEGVADIAKRINIIFDKAQDYRADRIARTETVNYNSAATQEAFEQSGVVEAKEWVTEPNPCQFCAPMDGKVVGLNDTFFKKGDTATGNEGGSLPLDYTTTEYPPLHPNCRCSLAPIFIEEKMFSKKRKTKY